jgi:hypothetical protein
VFFVILVNVKYGKNLVDATVETGTNDETEKLKIYRNYWWKTGNFHPRAKWEEVR